MRFLERSVRTGHKELGIISTRVILKGWMGSSRENIDTGEEEGPASKPWALRLEMEQRRWSQHVRLRRTGQGKRRTMKRYHVVTRMYMNVGANKLSAQDT